jgi:hypothetical protein
MGVRLLLSTGDRNQQEHHEDTEAKLAHELPCLEREFTHSANEE